MNDHEVFELGDVVLQCGLTLRCAKLAYKTYGALNAARDNVIVLPTFFAGQHTDAEAMLADGRALDRQRHFIVVPDLLGNGLSSSPSNTPAPFERAAFPPVSLYDNVAFQHRLLVEQFDICRIRLVVGFSVGAQQAFQWGALYPEIVAAIAPICGSARTSSQNRLALQAVEAALRSDTGFAGGWYGASPGSGLRAFTRAYAGWLFSHEFFEQQAYRALGLASVEDTVRMLDAHFLRFDANDLLAMLSTWQHADISANARFNGEQAAALAAITARAIVMPGSSDLLFDVADSARAVARMPNAELRPIESIWGHMAGLGVHAPDNAFIDAALRDLLSD